MCSSFSIFRQKYFNVVTFDIFYITTQNISNYYINDKNAYRICYIQIPPSSRKILAYSQTCYYTVWLCNSEFLWPKFLNFLDKSHEFFFISDQFYYLGVKIGCQQICNLENKLAFGWRLSCILKRTMLGMNFKNSEELRILWIQWFKLQSLRMSHFKKIRITEKNHF